MAIHVVDKDFDSSIFDGASVAFGVFDGVHLGHQYLIGQTIASAAAEDKPSVVLTFDRDPDEIFRPGEHQKLMSNQARIETLADSGVDDVIVLPFTPELYTLEPVAFLEQTFGAHKPAHIHVGSNFHFGAKAAGTADTLREWGEQTGTAIHVHDLVNFGDETVAATRIRALLRAGDVQGAAVLLGHPYTLCGTVEKGRGEGKGFGFATANLYVPENELVLANGVYAGYAWIEGQSNEPMRAVYKAALSVGVSPTFKEAGATANMEVHLIDFKGNIVGRTICIEFALRLEPLQKYDTVGELVERVTADIDWIRNNL